MFLWGLSVYPVVADDENLSKKSQNPVGDIISLPIEYWHYDGIANDSSVDALLLKPVYPTRIGKVNLINRLIIPYMGVDANVGGSDLGVIPSPETNKKNSGFGNVQYQGFLTPAEPGKVIWGLGPALELPTNTRGLGSDKWSAGAAGVVLSMPGNWVLGALLQNVWSFTGSGGDIGKLHRFGKLPVDFKLQAYTNVEKPTGGSEWSTMFAVKFLFPK